MQQNILVTGCFEKPCQGTQEGEEKIYQSSAKETTTDDKNRQIERQIMSDGGQMSTPSHMINQMMNPFMGMNPMNMMNSHPNMGNQIPQMSMVNPQINVGNQMPQMNQIPQMNMTTEEIQQQNQLLSEYRISRHLQY